MHTVLAAGVVPTPEEAKPAGDLDEPRTLPREPMSAGMCASLFHGSLTSKAAPNAWLLRVVVLPRTRRGT